MLGGGVSGGADLHALSRADLVVGGFGGNPLTQCTVGAIGGRVGGRASRNALSGDGVPVAVGVSLAGSLVNVLVLALLLAGGRLEIPEANGVGLATGLSGNVAALLTATLVYDIPHAVVVVTATSLGGMGVLTLFAANHGSLLNFAHGVLDTGIADLVVGETGHVGDRVRSTRLVALATFGVPHALHIGAAGSCSAVLDTTSGGANWGSRNVSVLASSVGLARSGAHRRAGLTALAVVQSTLGIGTAFSRRHLGAVLLALSKIRVPLAVKGGQTSSGGDGGVGALCRASRCCGVPLAHIGVGFAALARCLLLARSDASSLDRVNLAHSVSLAAVEVTVVLGGARQGARGVAGIPLARAAGGAGRLCSSADHIALVNGPLAVASG